MLNHEEYIKSIMTILLSAVEKPSEAIMEEILQVVKIYRKELMASKDIKVVSSESHDLSLSKTNNLLQENKKNIPRLFVANSNVDALSEEEISEIQKNWKKEKVKEISFEIEQNDARMKSAESRKDIAKSDFIIQQCIDDIEFLRRENIRLQNEQKEFNLESE